MRKHYLFAAFAVSLFTAGSLVAQPTLTAANTNFEVGDSYYTTSIDPTGLTPGIAGQNMTWDFSQFSPMGTSYSLTVKANAGSAYETQFPTATIYSDYTTGDNKEFFLTSSTEWSRVGVMPDGAPVITYSNPHKILSFPFTFNSSFTDTYAATFTSTLQMNRNGITSSVGDAYGTIILPGGQTVTDVLRVKLTENSTDSYNGTNMFTSSTENYYWFKPGFHGPVFTISIVTGGGQSYTFASLATLTPVSAPETLTQLSAEVYPNPANGNVTIRTGSENNVSATLVNSLGQEVRRQMVSGSEDRFSLDGIASGVYFMHLQSDGKSVTKKLVVE